MSNEYGNVKVDHFRSLRGKALGQIISKDEQLKHKVIINEV